MSNGYNLVRAGRTKIKNCLTTRFLVRFERGKPLWLNVFNSLRSGLDTNPMKLRESLIKLVKTYDFSFSFANMDKVVKLVGEGSVINGAYPV